jgi:predicted acylesterase/phospholipase RssA
VLALSAGGEGGAYGAGVVAGWKYNAAYPPPGFDLVTGISTGALLAPLVFLDEDAAAKRLYTNIATDDIYRPRSGLELLFANSLTDTEPLREKVQSTVTGRCRRWRYSCRGAWRPRPRRGRRAARATRRC